MTYDFGKPQSRNEAILQNMLGAKNEILPPFSRIEELLIDLLELLEEGGGGGGASIYIGPTPPEEPKLGMLWIDTSDDTVDNLGQALNALPKAETEEF